MRSNTPSPPRSSHKNKTLTHSMNDMQNIGSVVRIKTCNHESQRRCCMPSSTPRSPSRRTMAQLLVSRNWYVRVVYSRPLSNYTYRRCLTHSLTTIVQGPNVIQVLLLPNIGSYVRMLTPILQEQEAAIKQLEAQKCHDALLVRLPSRIFIAQYSSTLHAAYSYIGTISVVASCRYLFATSA